MGQCCSDGTFNLRKSKKIIALFTLFVFLSTNTVSAAPGVGALPVLGAGGADSKILLENPFWIPVGEKDGRIAGFFEGRADGPLVIHVQDAHANISAQKSTAKVIGGILAGAPSAARHSPAFILVEGAEGFISRAPLSAFLNTGVDPREMLLSKGVISGPELASLDHDQVVLWGIEDRGLYERNLKAWAQARRTREENLAFIQALGSKVRDELWNRAPQELKTLLGAEEILTGEDADIQKA